MKVTLPSRYRHAPELVDAILADERTRADAIEQAQSIYGKYWDMQIGRFFDCLHGLNTPQDPTSVEYIWWNGLHDFVADFSKAIESVTIPDSDLRQYERSAQSVCRKMTFEEGVQVFMQGYFSLPSFDAALAFTLYDYYLARKATYNRQAYERKCGELQMEELKKKRK